jgi:hypothetical protein
MVQICTVPEITDAENDFAVWETEQTRPSFDDESLIFSTLLWDGVALSKCLWVAAAVCHQRGGSLDVQTARGCSSSKLVSNACAARVGSIIIF